MDYQPGNRVELLGVVPEWATSAAPERYRWLPTAPLRIADDPTIRAWWTPEHDEVLRHAILSRRWWWHMDVFQDIVRATPQELLAAWTRRHETSSNYSWYGRLNWFAQARALQLGLYMLIPQPMTVICARCQTGFEEDEVVGAVLARLGDKLDVCPRCVRECLWESARQGATKAECVQYLMMLSQVIGRVPSQGFGEGIDDLRSLGTDERVQLLNTLHGRPTIERIRGQFGSWLKALIAAGVLPDGTRRTARGTQCVAQDGHTCSSIGEKTIDDHLGAHGIAHTREPRYPGSKMRGGFLIRDSTIVEYFGLAGNAQYDERSAKKRVMCREAGIQLIELFAEDLMDTRTLERKLNP